MALSEITLHSQLSACIRQHFNLGESRSKSEDAKVERAVQRIIRADQCFPQFREGFIAKILKTREDYDFVLKGCQLLSSKSFRDYTNYMKLIGDAAEQWFEMERLIDIITSIPALPKHFWKPKLVEQSVLEMKEDVEQNASASPSRDFSGSDELDHY